MNPQPETEKQNAIIEKTAKFIASQGAQMEILIKAKQGDNPQFQFLSKECALHAYYASLVTLCKAGKWPHHPPLPEGSLYCTFLPPTICKIYFYIIQKYDYNSQIL